MELGYLRSGRPLGIGIVGLWFMGPDVANRARVLAVSVPRAALARTSSALRRSVSTTGVGPSVIASITLRLPPGGSSLGSLPGVPTVTTSSPPGSGRRTICLRSGCILHFWGPRTGLGTQLENSPLSTRFRRSRHSSSCS